MSIDAEKYKEQNDFLKQQLICEGYSAVKLLK